MRRPRLAVGTTKAPLGVAALIAVPLYLAALLACSLALDEPHVVAGKEFPSMPGTEAKIWLTALIVPAAVLAVGAAGLALKRYGVYLACVGGIVACVILPMISRNWVGPHASRFPLGVDFIKDSDPSNLARRGQWEQAAQATIASITHWVLGLSICIVVVAVILEVRRRRGTRAMALSSSPIDTTYAATGGVPLITALPRPSGDTVAASPVPAPNPAKGGEGWPAAAAAQRYGVRSMTAPLRRVLLRRPASTGDFAGAGPQPGELDLLVSQHDQLCQLLSDLGCEVELADVADGLADATYVRDPGLVTGRGAVLFQMAKPARGPEPELLGAAFEAAGVPVAARLSGTAYADGGDLVWLDEHTMLAGRSHGTNSAALRQLTEILADENVRLESVDLPHDQGPGHALRLMSVISPLADDLALVYPPLAPVALMEMLADRGVTVVAVPAEEYATMACNVLAVRPRQLVVIDGNPVTRAALESAGCEVHAYGGSEISLKGDGGPTFLTAPIWRSA